MCALVDASGTKRAGQNEIVMRCPTGMCIVSGEIRGGCCSKTCDEFATRPAVCRACSMPGLGREVKVVGAMTCTTPYGPISPFWKSHGKKSLEDHGKRAQ